MKKDNRALIFSVQRFCLHDGPGIRTTLFFKGCPLRCVWCQNPESIKGDPELAFSMQRCLLCYQCAEVCGQGAIVHDVEQRIDFSRCNVCGQCLDVCPGKAIELVGRYWSAQELLSEVLKDRDFYLSSQGGVTLSGGEPLLQSIFLADFLPLLKRESISVTLETCGHVPWSRWSALLEYLDLIYFDLKILDKDRHQELTGRDNKMILDNFVRLADCFPALQPRFPLVPGLNDREHDLDDLAVFLKKCGQRVLHVLPYHRLGEAKLAKISTTRTALGICPPDARQLAGVKELFSRRGIDAVIYD